MVQMRLNIGQTTIKIKGSLTSEALLIYFSAERLFSSTQMHSENSS